MLENKASISLCPTRQKETWGGPYNYLVLCVGFVVIVGVNLEAFTTHNRSTENMNPVRALKTC